MHYSAQTFGPYSLAPGDKAKLVVAWVAGSGAGESDLYTWTRSHLYDFDGLKKGEEWMVEFFKRAKWAYDNEYDVPDSPPDVYVAVSNSPDAQNLLTWNSADGAMNPDYMGAEAQDVAGGTASTGPNGTRMGPGRGSARFRPGRIRIRTSSR